MFGKNQIPPKSTGIDADTKLSKKQFPDQHNRVEAFRLGWDVPQNNKKGQSEITGKVGQGFTVEEYQQLQQEAYTQNRQQVPQQRANSQQKVVYQQQQMVNNIFNADPNQKLEQENAKGYGNFYNVDKVQLRKKEIEDEKPKGYGQFYEKNQYGDYQNVPKPAQSTKQRYQ